MVLWAVLAAVETPTTYLAPSPHDGIRNAYAVKHYTFRPNVSEPARLVYDKELRASVWCWKGKDERWYPIWSESVD